MYNVFLKLLGLGLFFLTLCVQAKQKAEVPLNIGFGPELNAVRVGKIYISESIILSPKIRNTGKVSSDSKILAMGDFNQESLWNQWQIYCLLNFQFPMKMGL